MSGWERVHEVGKPGWRKRAPGYVLPSWKEVEIEQRRLDAQARLRARNKPVEQPRNWLAPGGHARGYGGSERWPFSVARALKSRGYRQGVLRALDRPEYNSSWRYWARHDLEHIVGPRMVENVISGLEEQPGLEQFLYELEEEEERREFAKYG